MSDLRFPMSLRPIVSKGYSQTRGSNIWRTEVQGGVPRQGRDTYFEPVPISVTLVVSSLGRQAFYSFLNNIDGGASSFIMPHDTGMGIEDHRVLITSDISDSTDDGKNWVITFTATAERTAIQEDTCLTKNLPDLYGCYGDCLGSFLKIYANYETTFSRIWSDEGPAGYPPINLLASTLDSRIVYEGPQVYYINRNGNLVQSAANEWPLTFIDGVAVGRVPPEYYSENLYINSGDLSSSSLINVTVDSETTSDMFSVTATTTSGSHYFYQNKQLDAEDHVSFSIIAASNGLNFLRLYIRNSDNSDAGSVIVNIDSKDIQSSFGGVASVTDLGDYVSVSISLDASMLSSASADYRVMLYASATTGAFPGDGVSGIVVFNPQIEKSAFATSPIVTDSSVVTRPSASAKVAMNGATSIDITYSDGSTVNVPAVDNYAVIPQANSAWGSKYITRIDFNVDG